MNESGLSPATKKLLEAAKADVPSSDSRARMWAGMTGVIGGVLGTAGTTASVMRGSATGSKVLTFSGLFGGTFTVGLATLLLTIGLAPQAPRSNSVAAGATLAAPVTTHSQPAVARSPHAVADLKPTPGVMPSAKPPATPARTAKPRPAEDSLAHEAALVTEARGALEHGNPELALRAIRAARALRSRQLVPEELAVEEQALRALGHSDEANGIDVQLRLMYPESALAR
jgi:hypothetical protein